jgi:Holliday junction resolvase RusA-like endonuclease
MSNRTSDGLAWLQSVSTGPLTTWRIVAEPAPVTRNVSRSGHIFHGKRYSEFYRTCQQQLAGFAKLPPAEAYVIHVEVISSRPKAGKFDYPQYDWDNAAKGPTDAITKAGLWCDDVRVTKALVAKRYAEPGEDAGVILTIGVDKDYT